MGREYFDGQESAHLDERDDSLHNAPLSILDGEAQRLNRRQDRAGLECMTLTLRRNVPIDGEPETQRALPAR